MKKRLISAIASTWLFLILLAFGSLNLGEANPSMTYLENGGNVPPSQVGAEPPTVIISPIENSSFLNLDNVNVTVIATSGNSVRNTSKWIDSIYYEVDWQQKSTYIYRYMNDELNPFNYSASLNLVGINGTQVPEGKHTLTVYAVEEGQYFNAPVPSELSGLIKIVYNSFQITGSTSVTFNIDRTVPNIMFLSSKNTTYSSNDIPLTFTVNEPTSKLAYSLDNCGNITMAGNMTLTGLSVGEHNVTISAWDITGNVGASKTLFFTIVEPLPSLAILVIASIAVVVLIVSLLLYRRHRKTAK